MTKSTDKQHPLYRTWKGMIYRCYYKTSSSYPNYGGRGIQVCDRWVDFDAFVKDMGPKPSPDCSINRIDNDGNYEPSNCRWSSSKTQNLNKRNNVSVRYGGVLTTLTELSERLGISYSVLHGRIRRGWPEHRWGEPVHKWSSKMSRF